MTGKAVLVGYDGSPGARDALAFAIEAARPRKSAVEVVHAWLPAPPPSRFAGGYSGPQDQELRGFAEAVLAEALDQAKKSGADIEVRGCVVSGPAAVTLLEAAERAHMLVVGSRGLGGFSGLLVGSTGMEVATHATCPVVVVRPPDPKVAPGPEAGRVVVGVDGSPLSEAALAFAFEQASWRGVGLTAVIAWDIPYLNVPGRVIAMPPDVLQAEHDTAEAVLAESLAGWQEKFPDVDIKTRVASGQPGHALITASAGALLLVVGSRGRGGFQSLLFGSVSHAVLHHAHGPVAVIHPATI